MLKRFLADLLHAATLDKDWFSAISTTNDPRTDWCGYPACEDNQLHGKDLLLAKLPGPHRVEYGYEPADSDTVKNIKIDSNWFLSTPMTVTQVGYHAT